MLYTMEQKREQKKKFGTGKERDVSALENNTRKSQDTGSTKLMEAGGSCSQCRRVKRLASAPYKPWKMTVRQVALSSVSTALVTSHKYLLECQLFSHLPLGHHQASRNAEGPHQASINWCSTATPNSKRKRWEHQLGCSPGIDFLACFVLFCVFSPWTYYQ